MRFQCPFCRNIVGVDSTDLGQDVQCGSCGEVVVVPATRVDSGAVIGDFILQNELGRGGMGVVYLSHQISLDRPVALKVLSSHYAKDSEFVVGFIKEARAAAKLNHPHIVQAYAVGEDEGVYYFAMENVEGETLKQVLKREQAIHVGYAVSIVQQISEALDYAWKEAQLIHRDIKPENIMITKKGSAKLADLGLARIAGEVDDPDSDEVMGTPHYISPEQLTGSAVDIRTDIYSLGATFYHLVTGRFPYEGESAEEITHMHVDSELVPPHLVDESIPHNISKIICKMMAKVPNRRYQDAEELVEDLRRFRRESMTSSASWIKGGKKSGKGAKGLFYHSDEMERTAVALSQQLLIERKRRRSLTLILFFVVALMLISFFVAERLAQVNSSKDGHSVNQVGAIYERLEELQIMHQEEPELFVVEAAKFLSHPYSEINTDSNLKKKLDAVAGLYAMEVSDYQLYKREYLNRLHLQQLEEAEESSTTDSMAEDYRNSLETSVPGIKEHITLAVGAMAKAYRTLENSTNAVLESEYADLIPTIMELTRKKRYDDATIQIEKAEEVVYDRVDDLYVVYSDEIEAIWKNVNTGIASRLGKEHQLDLMTYLEIERKRLDAEDLVYDAKQKFWVMFIDLQKVVDGSRVFLKTVSDNVDEVLGKRYQGHGYEVQLINLDYTGEMMFKVIDGKESSFKNVREIFESYVYGDIPLEKRDRSRFMFFISQGMVAGAADFAPSDKWRQRYYQFQSYYLNSILESDAGKQKKLEKKLRKLIQEARSVFPSSYIEYIPLNLRKLL